MPAQVVIAQPLTPERFLDLEALFSQGLLVFGRPVPPDVVRLAHVRRQRMRELAAASRAPGPPGGAGAWSTASDGPVVHGFITGERSSFTNASRSPSETRPTGSPSAS